MKMLSAKTIGVVLAGGMLAFSLVGCAGGTQASSSSSAGDAAPIGSSQAESTPSTVEPGDIQEYTFDENDMQGTMESAEAFVDEYVDFANKYKAEGEPADLKAQYDKLQAQYEELQSKLDSMTEANYSTADWQLYTESMARIQDKLETLVQ